MPMYAAGRYRIPPFRARATLIQSSRLVRSAPAAMQRAPATSFVGQPKVFLRPGWSGTNEDSGSLGEQVRAASGDLTQLRDGRADLLGEVAGRALGPGRVWVARLNQPWVATEGTQGDPSRSPWIQKGKGEGRSLGSSGWLSPG
jgi:hypothetical protein